MIKCKWRDENRVLVNIDGQVWPCCYLVNNEYEYAVSNTKSGYKDSQEVLESYRSYKDELNIFKNDMDSINKHQWWEELEQSWSDKSKTLKQCAKWCTQKEEENE